MIEEGDTSLASAWTRKRANIEVKPDGSSETLILANHDMPTRPFVPDALSCCCFPAAAVASTTCQPVESPLQEAAVPLLPKPPKPQRTLAGVVADAWESCKRVLKAFGPGLMVCLADTDGACLVTAAESGVEERYKLLMLQLVLIPVLYMSQELTIRLALYRKQGLVGCVRSSIGFIPALLIAVPLILSCIAAFVTEIANVASAMRLLGVPSSVTAVLTCMSLLALALKGSYTAAERVGLVLGSLQIVFVLLMFAAQPSITEILEDAIQFPINDNEFANLVTANIGAVIMPWMLAYQQSACALERNSVDELEDHRFETQVGSVLTQGVMSAVLIMAAAVGKRSIKNIDDLAELCRQICGSVALGNAITLFAVIGACLVAAIVVMLCAAWVVEDMFRQDPDPTNADNLETPLPAQSVESIEYEQDMTVVERIQKRPAYFLGIIFSVVVALIIVVTFGDEQVGFLDVMSQILNGILMVPVVAVLWYLCVFHLPECPLEGSRQWVTAFLFLVCSVFSVVGVFQQGD
jgi:Mn2+/Fe2+ NRAMP family transporter